MRDHGAIDERVRELVRSQRSKLERLVDQALERELAQLVEQRFDGHDVERTTKPAVPALAAETTRVCDGCGQTKPEVAFESIGAAAASADAETAAPPPSSRRQWTDRPAISADELARRSDRYGAICADELQRWLLDGGFATIEAGLLRPRSSSAPASTDPG